MYKLRSSEVKKSKKELDDARKNVEMREYINSMSREEARKNPIYNRTEGPSVGEKLSKERLELAKKKHEEAKAKSKRERVVRTSKALVLPKRRVSLG